MKPTSLPRFTLYGFHTLSPATRGGLRIMKKISSAVIAFASSAVMAHADGPASAPIEAAIPQQLDHPMAGMSA